MFALRKDIVYCKNTKSIDKYRLLEEGQLVVMFQLGKEATDFVKELFVLILSNHPGHEVTTETGGLDVGQKVVGKTEDVVDGVVVADDDLTGHKDCPKDLGLLVGTLGLMRKEDVDLLGGLLTQGDGVLKRRGIVVEEEEVGVAAMA